MIDFTFEEFEIEHLCAGARVTNPLSRNILEKCGFQWLGVELHRFEALGSSTPVDRFKLSRGVWSSLKNWGFNEKGGDCRVGGAFAPSPTTPPNRVVGRREGAPCPPTLSHRRTDRSPPNAARE